MFLLSQRRKVMSSFKAATYLVDCKHTKVWWPNFGTKTFTFSFWTPLTYLNTNFNEVIFHPISIFPTPALYHIVLALACGNTWIRATSTIINEKYSTTPNVNIKKLNKFPSFYTKRLIVLYFAYIACWGVHISFLFSLQQKFYVQCTCRHTYAHSLEITRKVFKALRKFNFLIASKWNLHKGSCRWVSCYINFGGMLSLSMQLRLHRTQNGMQQ